MEVRRAAIHVGKQALGRNVSLGSEGRQGVSHFLRSAQASPGMLLEPKFGVCPETCSNQEGHRAGRGSAGWVQERWSRLSKSRKAFGFPPKSTAQALRGGAKSGVLNLNDETRFRAGWSRVLVQIPVTGQPLPSFSLFIVKAGLLTSRLQS